MTSNYTVMVVTLVIWIGIFSYLVILDRKTKRLEGKK